MSDSQMKLLVSLLYLADSEMGTGHVVAWILISQKHDSIPASEPLCDIVAAVGAGRDHSISVDTPIKNWMEHFRLINTN